MGNKRKESPAEGEGNAASMEGKVACSMEGKPARKNFNWTEPLDELLISCMLDLVHKHQVENGYFKNGAFKELEVMMEKKSPGCGVKLELHIQSRHKKLKKDFNVVNMLRYERTCAASMDKGAFEEFIKVHPNCKNWNNKPLPYYYDLLEVFGKSGSASGRETGGIADAVYSPSKEAFNVVDVDEIQTPINVEDPRGDAFMEDMINEGVNMSQRALTPPLEEPDQPAKGRGSDPKHANVGGSNPPVKKKAKKESQTDEDIATVAAELGGLKPILSMAVEALGTILSEREREREREREEINTNQADAEAALMVEIGKIEGLTRCQVVDATMALVDNDRKTRLFYALDNDEDQKYLIMNLLH